MKTLVLGVGLLLACPVAAEAEWVLINNGLDCSNPGNVIDDDTYQADLVLVRNAGCGVPDPWSPCLTPGEATEVCIEEGGEVQELTVYESSVVTLNGGTILDSLLVRESSALTMNGGTVGWDLVSFQYAVIEMNGGSVGAELEAENYSTVTVNGGTVGEELFAWDSSTVNVNGGTVVGDLYAPTSATVTMNGGTVVGNLDSSYYATVTLNGGTLGGDLRAQAYSTVTVTGTGFAVDGSPVPFGDLSAQAGTLTGRLASGDTINNGFNRGGGDYTGTITLAPPGYLVVPALSLQGKFVLAAALLGSAVLWRRRVR